MFFSPAGQLPSGPPERLSGAEQRKLAAKRRRRAAEQRKLAAERRRLTAEQHLRNHAALHGLNVTQVLNLVGHGVVPLSEASGRTLYDAEQWLSRLSQHRDAQVIQKQTDLSPAAAQDYWDELLR